MENKIDASKLKPVSKEETTKQIVSSLQRIKSNLLLIKKATTFSLKTQKQVIVVERKQNQTAERLEKESKKESFKPAFKLPKLKLPEAPKTGILDWIKNFIQTLLIGFVFVKFFKELPKLANLLAGLLKVGEFIQNVLGVFLVGVINFIDFTYDKVDSFKKMLKSIENENFQKTFDNFTSNLDKYLNFIIIGGLAIASSGGFGGDFSGKPKGGRPSQKIIEPSLQEEISSTKKPKPKPIPKSQRTGPVINESVATAVERKGLSKALTKGVFVIGPLIDFGIRTLVFKEPVDKAAVGAISTGVGQAIGTALGGTIGGIVGSVVPIAGNLLAGGAGAFIGGLIGGFIGDWIGSSLYEMAKSNVTKPKIEKRAEGGQITRRGRQIGGQIRRTVKKAKKSPIKYQYKKPTPGKDVGGKEKIEKFFPDPKDSGTKNPLKTLEFAANRFSREPLFGPLISAGVRASFGEKSDKNTIKNVATNFGILLGNIIEGYIDINNNNNYRAISAMAEGGIVPRTAGIEQPNFGQKIGEMLAKSFETMMTNSTNDIFQNIIKQEKLKDFSSGEGGIGGFSGATGVGDSSGAGIVYNALIEEGFTHAQASGVIGNLMQESGGGTKNISPTADNGTHYGIAQWDKQNRWPRLKRYIESIGMNPNSVEGQAVGLIWEMKTHEKKAYELLKGAKTAREAAVIFLKEFERSGEVPGHQGYENRLIFAETISKDFVSGVPFDQSSGPTPLVIPYINQRSSTTGPNRECFSASSAMLASAYTGRNISLEEYNKIRAKYGDSTSSTAQIRALKELGITSNVSDNGSLEDVAKLVSRGIPVAIGLNHNNASGHWIVVTGVTPNGDFIVNDPFGKLKQKRNSGWEHRNSNSPSDTTGRNIVYKRDFLRSIFEDRGKGTGRIMRIQGSPRMAISQNAIQRPDLRNIPIGESKVSADIKAFRQFRTQLGAPASRFASFNSQNFQIREMGVYGSGNYNINPLADDIRYEVGVHKGAGHWENRAFDIPVPNLAAGDKVAKFWRDRGYKVLWRTEGHYNHVHVEVPKSRAAEFFRIVRPRNPLISSHPINNTLTATANRNVTINPNSIVSSKPDQSNVPQALMQWDVSTITPIRETVIATQVVERTVQVPVSSKKQIFPGESAPLNTDTQLQMLAIG